MVVLSGQRYLVDVGMGARGPVTILPLQHCATVISIAPRQARLLHGCLPEHSHNESSNMLWRLETQRMCSPSFLIRIERIRLGLGACE